MADKVPIEIFCIARSQVDRSEVRRWLDFLGAYDFQMPEDNAISNPALLIAMAAKRCYKSFTVDLNPNLSRIRSDWGEYLDNVLKSGHGSVLEHSVYTFAIENCSRVFTGEMNRHRAGWAISEGSMRFIRYAKSVPYWEPDSIYGPDVLDQDYAYPFRQIDLKKLYNDLAHGGIKLQTIEHKKHLTRILFERSFESQRDIYAVLEQVWFEELSPDSKFKQKKEITSLLRRTVGMGVATGGVWTGNIRALRHVITMRCDPAAEEEILHIFSRIAVMMKEKEPMLFGDFEQENGYWKPKYRKV